VAAQIHLGQAVNVHVQALNRDFEGSVSRFADSLNRQTRTMDTQIDVSNRDGSLMPGMYSQTSLILGEKKGALTIPLEAVTRNGEEATVLAVSAQNTVQERHVQLGMEDAARVEVLSGLSAGDRVLLGNRSQFRDGQKIQPVEVKDTPGETERPN
jgi:RND family efflux transporter MFP subunit